MLTCLHRRRCLRGQREAALQSSLQLKVQCYGVLYACAALGELHTLCILPNNAESAGPKVDKGLGILEWTGSLVPQGLLVKGRTQPARSVQLMLLTLTPFLVGHNTWKGFCRRQEWLEASVADNDEGGGPPDS